MIHLVLLRSDQVRPGSDQVRPGPTPQGAYDLDAQRKATHFSLCLRGQILRLTAPREVDYDPD
jgi:hypothetical protein